MARDIRVILLGIAREFLRLSLLEFNQVPGKSQLQILYYIEYFRRSYHLRTARFSCPVEHRVCDSMRGNCFCVHSPLAQPPTVLTGPANATIQLWSRRTSRGILRRVTIRRAGNLSERRFALAKEMQLGSQRSGSATPVISSRLAKRLGSDNQRPRRHDRRPTSAVYRLIPRCFLLQEDPVVF